MSGEESDMDESTLSQRTYVSSTGYEGDTEPDELINFFKDGKIPGVIQDSSKDEVPQLTKEQVIEEIDLNTQASQAVEDLEITIDEQPQEALEIIDEQPQEQNIDEESIARTKAVRIKNPIQRFQPPTIKIESKKSKKQPTFFQSSQTEVSSQYANDYLMNETEGKGSVGDAFIVKRVRLETRSPDDQAKVIYGDDFNRLKMSRCYLCGFELSRRISSRHNERWGYTHNSITSSYDHTAPVNFSSIVTRIPSQYNTKSDKTTKNRIEEYEKPFLRYNGKFACFHCNYTKSQMMFIKCDIVNGVINFKNFKPNELVIENFVNKLYSDNGDWSKDLGGNNTLHQCIDVTFKGNVQEWKIKRIASIKKSADELCTMIKAHVEQKSVIKRYYYTKLLIQKAYQQIEKDPVYLALLTSAKKTIYSKKYIAHIVAKAEATNPNFVKPWNTTKKPITNPFDKTIVKNTNTQQRQQEQSTSSTQRNTDRSKTARNEILKEKREASVTPDLPPVSSSVKPDLPLVTLPSGERVVPTRIISPYQRQQESTNRLSRSNRAGSRRKRKTYRRIRLF
jgi:hypothetical protein